MKEGILIMYYYIKVNKSDPHWNKFLRKCEEPILNLDLEISDVVEEHILIFEGNLIIGAIRLTKIDNHNNNLVFWSNALRNEEASKYIKEVLKEFVGDFKIKTSIHFLNVQTHYMDFFYNMNFKTEAVLREQIKINNRYYNVIVMSNCMESEGEDCSV
jgi:hypothetical protein